jgi:Flp pilus assembly protein TadD
MKIDKKKSSNQSVPHQKNSPLPRDINSVLTLFNEARYAEAEPLAQALTMRFPLHGYSWTVLGTILRQMGRRADALVPMQKAAELSPNNPDVHNNLGIVLRDCGRLSDAEASFQRAIEINQDFAEALSNLGVTQGDMGRLDDSEASFRQALQIKPDYVEVHINLGVTLHNQDRLEEAEASFKRAIRVKPDFAEVHNNLGNVLLDMGRFEEAEASYLQAMTINPNLVEIHCNLGKVLMSLGRMGEAEIFLNQAIELAPGDAKPLTTALTYIAYQQNDPRFNQLEAIYSQRGSLPLEDRIKLNFAMGKAMEEIGQYDRSFSAYEEGNQLYYQGHPFDEAEEERSLQNICTLFTDSLPKECSALANTRLPIQDDRVPIFIVGMLRSGSTLIEQVLSSHPDVYGAGELSVLKAVLSCGDLAYGQDSLSAIRKLGQEYLDRVWKFAPEARYITDKQLGNYFHLGMIHLMLPNAKIIHATRDPMDTCFSCYALQFTHGHEYTYELSMLGREYQRYMKLMQHWHSVLPPGRILDVRYEDNIADPEREARRMLDYLGLPWNPACLKSHENKRPIRTASVTQVRKPIYSSSVARWKRFEKHLEPLLGTICPASTNNQTPSARMVSRDQP